MGHSTARLRRGEVVAAVAAVVLAAVLVLMTWFARKAGGGSLGAPAASLTGWQALPELRWLVLAAVLAALALAFTQATRPAPAIPVSLSVIATTLGALTTLALAIRLATTGASPQAGAWLGLAATVGLTVGAFMSLREEGGWTPSAEHPVETVALGPRPGS